MFQIVKERIDPHPFAGVWARVCFSWSLPPVLDILVVLVWTPQVNLATNLDSRPRHRPSGDYLRIESLPRYAWSTPEREALVVNRDQYLSISLTWLCSVRLLRSGTDTLRERTPWMRLPAASIVWRTFVARPSFLCCCSGAGCLTSGSMVMTVAGFESGIGEVSSLESMSSRETMPSNDVFFKWKKLRE